MMSIPRTLAAAIAATAALGLGAATASAGTVPAFGGPGLGGVGLGGPSAAGSQGALGPCATAFGPNGQGPSAGTFSIICNGGGLSFIGPAVGQVASVIGPTIIGPAVIGNVVVSAGNGAAGP
jgi:DNA polymerase III subunit gamma/tau